MSGKWFVDGMEVTTKLEEALVTGFIDLKKRTEALERRYSADAQEQDHAWARKVDEKLEALEYALKDKVVIGAMKVADAMQGKHSVDRAELQALVKAAQAIAADSWAHGPGFQLPKDLQATTVEHVRKLVEALKPFEQEAGRG